MKQQAEKEIECASFDLTYHVLLNVFSVLSSIFESEEFFYNVSLISVQKQTQIHLENNVIS